MGCHGPNNEKWDGETCVGTPSQTSCDSVNQTTCYYADVQFEQGGERKADAPREYFGGQFAEGDSGEFRVDLPGPLAKLGVKAGDVIGRLDGKEPTAKAILAYTSKRPAYRGEVTRSTDNELIDVRLWR